MRESIKQLKTFLLLWSTQSLSQLGSAMTTFALTLWLYAKTGSALQTAALAICSYAPYVIMSIFAGALSDRWDKKKVMLFCDTFAAGTTVLVLVLLRLELLRPVHMYVLNAINGLMNTIQQPAGEVAMTLITPKEEYQRTSGFRYFSQSVVTILNPVIATAVYSIAGMEAVIYIDLTTYVIAFVTLLCFIKIPKVVHKETQEPILHAAKAGINYLKENPMILTLILFLSGVNLVASSVNAVLPAYILPRQNGGEEILGMVSSCAGIATLIGSLLVTILPKPKNRVRIVYLTMLFSVSIGNFLLAFSKAPIFWCLGQLIGWILVPIMGANLDVILRTTIPVNMQGRVYSCRNTLQFFTIPVGLFMGGWMVDNVCEPFMANVSRDNWLSILFETGKGSGAAVMMFLLGMMGTVICLAFGKRLKKYRFEEG